MTGNSLHNIGVASSLDVASSSAKTARMPPPIRSIRRYHHTIRQSFGIITLIAGFCVFFGCAISNLISPNVFRSTSSPNLESESISWTPTREQADWRISKATILYESSGKTYNAHILALHDFHDEYFNYKTQVLRTPLVRGALNKFLYLQSLIINELRKPVEQQVEWILYFNGAVILANPHTPLHHFLPPITDVETFKSLSIVAAKSGGDYLNTSVFFIRVSGGSLRILTEAMETIYNAPDTEGYENEDTDKCLPSTALQDVLYREHHREKVIFQPWEWYNSTTSLFYQPCFPSPAHHLVPISETLAVDDEQRPMFPDAETVHGFWHTLSEARRVLDEAKEEGHTNGQGRWWDMVKEVKEWVELRAWDTDELKSRVTVLKVSLNDS